MIIYLGGIPQPIYGIPAPQFMIDCIPRYASIRYRFRNKDWARVFIWTPGHACREFILVQRTPEYWGYDFEQGRNGSA